MTIEIKVPDIGDFKDVPVIEIHVQPGQSVKGEDPLVTLESDKATMDIPAPQAGTVGELRIKVGDRVGEGAVILTLEPEGAAAIPPKDKVKEGAAPASGEPAGYGSSAGVYETIEVKVPDIGDFKDVPVIEVHVAEGAMVKAEEPLLSLESDKATMDVPSPAAGTVVGLKVKVGDKVSEGTPDPDAADRRRQAGARRRCAGTGRYRADAQARHRRQGRLPRRDPGAGRRPRRLHRRLPRRRPRPPGGAGRALGDAGRSLPQCRLHPVQGAAARGQGDRRDQGDGPPWHQLRRTDGRHRPAARLEGRHRQEADRRSVGSRQGAQGDRGPGHRPVHLAEPAGGHPGRRRQEDGELRAGDHRRRLRGGHHAVHPARRPARDRFHRARSSWAACPSGCW